VAGATPSGFLAKPFTPDQLRGTLRAALGETPAAAPTATAPDDGRAAAD
jgi:hypothetical protein